VQVKSEVHKLAGSASVLGASKLRILLNKIETKLSENDLVSAAMLIEVVPSVWQSTLEDAEHRKTESEVGPKK